MGPLIPMGFVNPDLNLFFAFVIGLGFGYVLEQAGFSSSRKLAGVFYGYDFVVLKVFFTAAVTAMIGLLMFSYLGWIDYSMLYINPTYLWSAIVGGVIMGVGFILGGFCPGTSMVAAVIGKIDAIVFVGGMLIGIFLFGRLFDLFQPLYTGSFLGNIFVYESLGFSRGLFAFLLIAVALMAFWITQKIEDNINKVPAMEIQKRPSLIVPTLVALGLGALILVLPAQPRSFPTETSPQKILTQINENKHLINIDEVAYSLINGKDRPIQLIDVRAADDFSRFALPGALNIPIENILDRRYEKYLRSADKRLVFYSNSNTLATEAWLVATRAGLEDISVLNGGLNGFVETIFTQDHSTESRNLDLIHQAKFREKAKSFFLSGKARPEEKSPATPVIKLIEVEMPATGGC
jgi:rhodanese-related sulfurtransferase/uncharacterized membrane protein YedE/YeeE